VQKNPGTLLDLLYWEIGTSFMPKGGTSKRKLDDVYEEEFPLDTLTRCRAFALVIQGIINKIVQYMETNGIVLKEGNADEVDITDEQKQQIIDTLTDSQKAHYRAFDRAMPLGHIDHKTPRNNFFTCFPATSVMFRAEPSMARLDTIMTEVTSTQGLAGKALYGKYGVHRVGDDVLADFRRLCRDDCAKLCLKCWESGHYQHRCTYSAPGDAVTFPASELNEAYMNEPDRVGFCKQVDEHGKKARSVRQEGEGFKIGHGGKARKA
jgi:hypothetical protein